MSKPKKKQKKTENATAAWERRDEKWEYRAKGEGEKLKLELELEKNLEIRKQLEATLIYFKIEIKQVLDQAEHHKNCQARGNGMVEFGDGRDPGYDVQTFVINLAHYARNLHVLRFETCQQTVPGPA